MSKRHTFEDGVVVDLDDDVEVDDFLNADAEEGTDEHSARRHVAEEEVDENDDEDEEPAGIEVGE